MRSTGLHCAVIGVEPRWLTPYSERIGARYGDGEPRSAERSKLIGMYLNPSDKAGELGELPDELGGVGGPVLGVV